jgi:hypothetical protein
MKVNMLEVKNQLSRLVKDALAGWTYAGIAKP